jgi:hypothetical protein
MTRPLTIALLPLASLSGKVPAQRLPDAVTADAKHYTVEAR